jgi:hypothetical protein
MPGIPDMLALGENRDIPSICSNRLRGVIMVQQG